jgi:diguanylate cyclase (GGDEF)-like protein/PAS domain S-box-containing protein
LLALLLLALVFWFYVATEKQVDAESRRRIESVLLVDLLRQSSDDLTRMARSQVQTGDARYRQAFDAIGAIRDGRQPWPEGYEGVYWDLVLSGAREPGRPGPTQALLDRMREAGFTPEEFALLAKAKQHSDDLKQVENRAMDLAAAGPGTPQALEAARWLHDDAYHQAKAAIMGPIDEVLASVGTRTAGAVADAVARAAWARLFFILLAVLLALLLLRGQRRLRRLMGGSVAEVHQRLTQIGSGHFDAPLPVDPVPESSVLGRLLQTQRQLQRIDSERLLALRNLQLSAGVFTHAREGIMITDVDGLIVDVNDAFCRLTGYGRGELFGRSPRMLESGRHDAAFYEHMMEELRQHDQWQGEVWDKRKSGELFASLQTVSAVRNSEGELTHYISLMTDITGIKEQAQRLEHIAHYDALTALPNRVLLADRLKQAMAMAPRHGRRLALVYLDLDGFKAVNDLQGHEAGDRLLVELAKRLRQLLREGDTLARLGGDEFVAVLLDLPDEATCEALLSRMLGAIAQPFLTDTQAVRVSGSFGVSYYPQAEAVDADQLLRQADQAMYQAKLAGKNRFQVFDAELAAQVRGQLESVERIRQALQQNEFVLHYQPKVNLRSGRVLGVEALIRWQHPERGLLAPGLFLPIVEDHPLICDIGDWVLSEGLAQLAAWRVAGLELGLSINISARHLQQAGFIGKVLAQLQQHPDLRPQDLLIEVLETSALEDLSGVSRTMADGRSRGLGFSLDDFGTGYSSLTYLRRLPVEQLKIDQSFVRDMLDDADDLAILDGVIGLAAAFRREVIAEGVESAEHGAVLLQLGCELAQGFGIARPMPADVLSAWIAGWQPPAAWAGLTMVTREDLPLLRASMDHRARARALERHLSGQRAQPPSLEPSECRLGQWLGSPASLTPRFGALRQAYVESMKQARALVRLAGRSPTRPEVSAWQQAEAALQQQLQKLLQPGLSRPHQS